MRTVPFQPLDPRSSPHWLSLRRDSKPCWGCCSLSGCSHAGAELRQGANMPSLVKDFTIVPMPPSKAKDDPLYDDRLVRIAKAMAAPTIPAPSPPRI